MNILTKRVGLQGRHKFRLGFIIAVVVAMIIQGAVLANPNSSNSAHVVTSLITLICLALFIGSADKEPEPTQLARRGQ